MISQFKLIDVNNMDAAALVLDIQHEVKWIDEIDSEVINEAIVAATLLHAGQIRHSLDGSKEPYIVHPLRVALLLLRAGVTLQAIIVAAILHDTVEDCSVKFMRLFYDGKLNQVSGDIGEYARRELMNDWQQRKFGRYAASIVLGVSNEIEESGPKLPVRERIDKYVSKARLAVSFDPGNFMTKLGDFLNNAGGLDFTNIAPKNRARAVYLATKYSAAADIFIVPIQDDTLISVLCRTTGIREESLCAIASELVEIKQRLDEFVANNNSELK